MYSTNTTRIKKKLWSSASQNWSKFSTVSKKTKTDGETAFNKNLKSAIGMKKFTKNLCCLKNHLKKLQNLKKKIKVFFPTFFFVGGGEGF